MGEKVKTKMPVCPNCGNYYDHADPDNRQKVEAGERSVIEFVDFINQEMDESRIKMRCYACSSTWTGRYKRGKLIEVEQYHPKEPPPQPATKQPHSI